MSYTRVQIESYKQGLQEAGLIRELLSKGCQGINPKKQQGGAYKLEVDPRRDLPQEIKHRMVEVGKEVLGQDFTWDAGVDYYGPAAAQAR
jgi:hypothetical protein